MNKDNLDWLVSTIIMLCSFGIMYMSVPCGIIVFAVAITLHPVVRKMIGMRRIGVDNLFGAFVAAIIILAALGYAIFLFVNKPSVQIEGEQLLVEGNIYAFKGIVKNGDKIVDKEVEWLSDSGCIGIDNNGGVLAYYPGEATITLVYSEDKDITDELTVTVVAAASVGVDETEVSVDQFDSYVVGVSAAGYGNLTINCKSDDEKIASAELEEDSKIRITGGVAGATVITIEVSDENGTKAAEKITVSVINPLSVELPGQIEMLTTEEGTLPLYMYGAKGSTEIKIHNSDEAVAQVEIAEEGIHINALTEGSTTIQLNVVDEAGNEAESSCDITVKDKEAEEARIAAEEEERARIEAEREAREAEEAEQARIEEEQARLEEAKKEREEFIASCKEVSYMDLYQYPDSLKEEPIKLTVDITSQGQGGLVFVLSYTAMLDGHEITVFDEREIKEPRLVEGNTYTIYGYGNGMYTAWTMDSFLSLEGLLDTKQMPSVNIKFIEMDED